MLYPTIDELTQGKYNRYELSLATAKCARIVTDEYVKQREEAEKSITGNKETDKPINAMIDRELRDEKAVKTAIRRLYDGEYAITLNEDESNVFVDDEKTVVNDNVTDNEVSAESAEITSSDGIDKELDDEIGQLVAEKA